MAALPAPAPPPLPPSAPAPIPPPAIFDVTVPPGADLQLAIDGCPTGGSVLLLPGVHSGPLLVSKEVHLFGRGEATVACVTRGASAISCDAPSGTLSGLIVRKGPLPEGAEAVVGDHGIWIRKGRMRVVDCDASSEARASCVRVDGGKETDPVVQGCK